MSASAAIEPLGDRALSAQNGLPETLAALFEAVRLLSVFLRDFSRWLQQWNRVVKSGKTVCFQANSLAQRYTSRASRRCAWVP